MPSQVTMSCCELFKSEFIFSFFPGWWWWGGGVFNIFLKIRWGKGGRVQRIGWLWFGCCMCSLHVALDSSVLKPAPPPTLHILIESSSKVVSKKSVMWSDSFNTLDINSIFSIYFYVSHIFRYVKIVFPWTLEFKLEHTLLNSSHNFGYNSRMNCNNSNRVISCKGLRGRCSALLLSLLYSP